MVKDTAKKILEYLDANNQAGGKELSLYLGITDRAVRKQLKRMLEEKKIYKIGAPPRVHYRIYRGGMETDLNSQLYAMANYWASEAEPSEPGSPFYCQTSAIFLSKLAKLQNHLSGFGGLENIFPLILAVAGEIGDNSFAHNIGNWPDIPGIFFGYNLDKKEIVLADRGRGIFKTLHRVKTGLKDDYEALRVAFEEIISGRAPEERGNGLKFVRKVVVSNDMNLYFKSGNAELMIGKGDKDLNIKRAHSGIRGCIALIKF